MIAGNGTTRVLNKKGVLIELGTKLMIDWESAFLIGGEMLNLGLVTLEIADSKWMKTRL